MALQNQINPPLFVQHLGRNSRRALTAGLDTVAKMTEALSTFFRYTISNVEHLVSLEDELRNIENYYVIQRYRFGERINLSIEYDDEDDRDELGKCRMPKLTLQPIVENAIIHGIERKIGRGNIRIKLEATSRRLMITVSDDGVGMDETACNSSTASWKRPRLILSTLTAKKRGGSLSSMSTAASGCSLGSNMASRSTAPKG